jgi:hypothetical protein
MRPGRRKHTGPTGTNAAKTRLRQLCLHGLSYGLTNIRRVAAGPAGDPKAHGMTGGSRTPGTIDDVVWMRHDRGAWAVRARDCTGCPPAAYRKAMYGERGDWDG